MQKTFVLGVDGGGTKTHCVVMDQDGRVLGEGRAASTNRNSVGDEAAQANLHAAIRAALQTAACPTQAVAALCLGMAGVDRPAERTLITTWVAEWLPLIPIIVENDALVALASGTQGDLYGVVLISGTGMIVYGVDRQGQRRRAGGWGALLGDRGSGYAIGMAGLTAIANAADGLGPPTQLTQVILHALGLSNPQALIGWVYADMAWARFAGLAPLVFQCAEQGDTVAQGIVAQAAKDLAATVGVVVRSLQLTEVAFPLVLAGGNLRPGLLSGALRQQVASFAPYAQLIQPTIEPAVGAALLALKHLNKPETR